MLGVIGVLQTALIVNAITKYLSLTHEENKIMHFVDRHSKSNSFFNAKSFAVVYECNSSASRSLRFVQI